MFILPRTSRNLIVQNRPATMEYEPGGAPFRLPNAQLAERWQRT